MSRALQIEIVTSFYIPTNEKRKSELIKALDKNLSNKYINKIHFFVDNENCIEFLKNKYYELFNYKIKICGVGKQPLYSDLFLYCNTLKNRICMITNSDIWLDDIKNINIHVFDKLKKNNQKTIFALTRHENDLSCPLIDCYEGSHDSFIFISPIDEQIIKHVKHKQNVWGAENVVLYELNKINYKLYNPCKQIVIVHEHGEQMRNPERIIINRGDIDGDGKFKKRSRIISPCFLYPC